MPERRARRRRAKRFRRGEYDKARTIFSGIVDAEKNSPPVLQEAMYYHAECLRMQHDYPRAADLYSRLLNKFPSSAYREQCVAADVRHRQLLARRDARSEMKEDRERREGKRWVVWPRYVSFEKSKPLLDREGRAIQMLEQVRLHDINGPLADQALFWCGVVKMYNEDYRDADYYLSQIHARHPESPLAAQSIELAISLQAHEHRRRDYDGRKTAEARNLIQAALRSYPEIANDPKKRAFLEKQTRQRQRSAGGEGLQDGRVLSAHRPPGVGVLLLRAGASALSEDEVRADWPRSAGTIATGGDWTSRSGQTAAASSHRQRMPRQPTPPAAGDAHRPTTPDRATSPVTAAGMSAKSATGAPRATKCTDSRSRQPVMVSRHPRSPLFALAACALALPSCAWDGHFDLLGYSTKPNYDTTIRTVRVPIFKNRVALVGDADRPAWRWT